MTTISDDTDTDTDTGTDTDRAEAVLTLARLACGPDPVGAILGWLSRRIDGTALLVDAHGAVVDLSPCVPLPSPAELASVAAAVTDVHERGIPSAVLRHGDAQTAYLVALDPARRAHPEPGPGPRPEVPPAPNARSDRPPYLAAVAPARNRHGILVTDAARILGPCWRSEQAELHRHRVEMTEAQAVEIAMHLLMNGHTADARKIVTTLHPRLPVLFRVGVVECSPLQRAEITECVDRTTGGRAWIVPFALPAEALVWVLPVDDGPPGTGSRAHAGDVGRLLAERYPSVRVGVSGEVALFDFPNGLEQARQALSTAFGAPERYACFDEGADLVPLIGAAGLPWALELLRPCLEYAPSRFTDPGSATLLNTLYAWLALGGGACSRLEIHRNTLSARLRFVEELLGLDLDRIADRSAAWLALRLRCAYGSAAVGGTPLGDGRPAAPLGSALHRRPAEVTAALTVLLATPPATTWARARLAAIRPEVLPTGMRTVRAWLHAEGRLSTAAAALGISLPGMRKRLARIESALGRPLLHSNEAKYELWLAVWAADGVEALGGLR